MKPGIYDMPMAEYLSLTAFSASVAHAIDSRSLKHAWTDSSLNPDRVRDDNKEADLGIYAHACLLEGGHSALEIVQGENWTKKCIHNGVDAAAHVHRKAIRASGKLPILAHQLAEVDAMCAKARAPLADPQCQLNGAMTSGRPELTLIWERDGVLCKARPDWLNDERRLAIHYKTTANAAPNAWQRGQLTKQGYDLAAVHYEDGLQALTGKRYESIFLVQEVEPPYECSLHGLAPAMRELVSMKLSRAFTAWKRALESGVWTGYPKSVCYAEPMPWQITEEEERDAHDAYDELQAREGIQA